MKLFLTLFLFDILLGFVLQAAGCAVLLYTVTRQRLKSRSFLLTAIIFTAIAIIVRLICNYGLINFGFHTVLIWLIFVIVAILYNKFPALQSTVSILLSGMLIAIAEILTGIALTLILGKEKFNAIMDNTATIEGQILRAKCGMPANILFLVLVLAIHMIISHRCVRLARDNNVTGEDATA